MIAPSLLLIYRRPHVHWDLRGPLVGEVLERIGTCLLKYYLTNFLGSIIGKMPAGQTFEESRRFTPLGALLSGAPVPSATYAWTGNTGSRHTGLAFAEQYNLARHYSNRIGQWTTRDPLWPEERAYGYVKGNPVTWLDPEGKAVQAIVCVAACAGAAGCIGGLLYACKDWDKAYASYAECAYEFIASLPVQSLVGCAASLAGCVVCLARHVDEICKRAFDGVCSDAEWKAYSKLIHNPLSCDGKRKCSEFARKPKTPELCAELSARIAAGSSCVAARLVRHGACYRSDRNPAEHAKQLTDAIGTLTECSLIYARKRC